MSKYFGTDGFRGYAGKTITSWHAYKVGRFLGWYFGSRVGKKCRAVIGKDPRLSSYTLEYAVSAGLTASGGDAYVMHVTTTPSVSFVARSDNFDCGIMISASHNPYCDNGIKLFNGSGEKMDRQIISLIERYIDEDEVMGKRIPFAYGDGIGKTVDYVAGRNRYTGHLIALSTHSFKGFKVGLDCANGSGYKIAVNVFNALGATVFAIGDNPDGLNVNEGVGSTHVHTLKNLVMEKGLDVGFAFDGDADRCVCVDHKGNVCDGDTLLYVLAKHLKKTGELKGGVVATVMSNGGLEKSLLKEDIPIYSCEVGDINVYEKMRRTECALGGEKSGHIILSKIENVGDGIVTALAVMKAIIDDKTTLYDLSKGLVKYPQVMDSVRVKDKGQVIKNSALLNLLQTLKDQLKDGRILVRPSGTEEMIRVMVECADNEKCGDVLNKIISAVKTADGQDG